jgi:hypothetical protein
MSPADQIRQACESIIGHYTAALTPGKAKLEPITSTAIEAPTPLPLRVLNARGMATIYLASWATVVAGGRKLSTAPSRYDTLALARFVALHSDWLGKHEAGESAAKQLATIAAELRDVATGVTKPARIPVGPCVDQSPDSDTLCTGGLIAHMIPPASITCDTNQSHTWPPVRWPNLKIRMSRLDPEAAAELVARLSGNDLT